MDSADQILVAHDFSGSTSGSTIYHGTVKGLIKDLGDYKVLLWDTVAEECDKKRFDEILNTRKGRGGTNPLSVAQYVFRVHFRGVLYLITDGQIPLDSVTELDNFLDKNELRISKVVAHLIQTSSEKIDVTVIAPFVRRYPHEVILHQKGEEAPKMVVQGNTDITSFLDKLRAIQTIPEFEAEFDSIFSDVLAKMMGASNNIKIHDEILQLQKRLLIDMKRVPNDFDYQGMIESFEKKDIGNMINSCKNLNELAEASAAKLTWPPKIYRLLAMTSGSLGSVFSISALGSSFNADRVRRADVVQSFETTSADNIDDVSSPTFLCPISYEEEKDIVLLIKNPDQPILAGLEKDTINSILTSPLNALRYPEFIKTLISIIDHPISLRSLKDAEESGYSMEKSPVTRAPILGGLVLGPSEDHCKATNWTIAKLLSGGKATGNPDQWFELIWYLVETGKIPYLNEILPHIRAHMLFRCKSHCGTASLTNIPYACIYRVPVGIAAWFTLCFPLYQRNDIDILSCNSIGVSVLIKMVELCEYPLPDKIKEYALAHTMDERVKFMFRKNNRSILDNLIPIAYNCVKINDPSVLDKYRTLIHFIPEYIPIDGEPDPVQREKFLKKLPYGFGDVPIEVVKLVINKFLVKGHEATISFAEFSGLKPIPAFNWIYGNNEYKDLRIELCPLTARPYSIVPATMKSWQEEATHTFGDYTMNISAHSLFARFFKEFRVIPSFDEFLAYVYVRTISAEKPTLPYPICSFVNCVLTGYQELVAQHNIMPDKLYRLILGSSKMQDRKKKEHEYLEQQGG